MFQAIRRFFGKRNEEIDYYEMGYRNARLSEDLVDPRTWHLQLMTSGYAINTNTDGCLRATIHGDERTALVIAEMLLADRGFTNHEEWVFAPDTDLQFANYKIWERWVIKPMPTTPQNMNATQHRCVVEPGTLSIVYAGDGETITEVKIPSTSTSTVLATLEKLGWLPFDSWWEHKGENVKECYVSKI